MSRVHRIDWIFLIPIVALLVIGAGTIASISPVNLENHLFYLGLSLLFYFIFSFLDIRILMPFSPIIYLLSLLFLVLPFVFGIATRGSVRWIPVGGLTIQPSEIVKPFLALISAWYWGATDFSFKKFLFFAILAAPPFLLVFIQPDLGSSLMVLFIFISIILFSGIKLRHLLILAAGFLLISPLLWFSLKDYQRLRIEHFLNPYTDPLGEGYNLIQAKITVGSGGLFGRGIGRGTQSHLAFLPERHTDFIFSSYTEELGFTGALVMLLFYLLLFLKILKIGKNQKEKPEFLLATGLFAVLFFQTIVNLGMNIGILPITGITLPLISYGGSSILATMISLGMLNNLSVRGKKEKTIEIK